jgi:hypothetical protein
MLAGHQRESNETQSLADASGLKPHLHRLERACCPLGRLWHGQKKTSKTHQTSNLFQGCNQQDRKWESHLRMDLEGKGLILGWPQALHMSSCHVDIQQTRYGGQLGTRSVASLSLIPYWESAGWRLHKKR